MSRLDDYLQTQRTIARATLGAEVTFSFTQFGTLALNVPSTALGFPKEARDAAAKKLTECFHSLYLAALRDQEEKDRAEAIAECDAFLAEQGEGPKHRTGRVE